MVSWQYWHYCDCDDPTTSGPGVQARRLRRRPAARAARTSSEAKLDVLSRPYPQLVAGTPLGYDFDPAAKTFDLRFSTTGPAGSSYLPPRGKGPVPASTPQTEVFVPERHFPGGYEVDVAGGGIASGPNARLLRVVVLPRRQARSRCRSSGRAAPLSRAPTAPWRTPLARSCA